VEIEGLYSMDRDYFLELLGANGRAPEPDQLKKGIKRLFLTGLFDDISIYEENGVLRVKVKEREIIERIKVRGNFYLKEEEIINAFLLKESEPMRYDLLEEARKELLDILSKKGFPEADLEFKIKKRRSSDGVSNSRVTIIIDLKEGRPVLIKKIEGPQLLLSPPTELIPFIRLSVDEPFDLFLLERDISFIRNSLKEDGYINPDVRASFQEGILKFNVTPGIKLEIEFKGNTVLSDKELLRLMPFEESGTFSDELVEEARSRIIYAYRKIGFPFAETKVEWSSDDGRVRLIFYIVEGSRYRIKGIHFSGNSIPPEKLLEIGGIKEGDYYVPEELTKAIERIKGLYQSLGYKNLSVEEPVLDFNQEQKTVSVAIEIKEGVRFTIDRIKISGNSSFEDGELINVAGLKEGMPFNERDVNDARLRLLEFYSSKGYRDVECEPLIEIQNSSVTVHFNIVEGGRYLFGRTIIKGNLGTSHRVIKRELSYKDGEPFRQTDLLETSRRLYRLGLFSEIEIEPVKVDSTQDVIIKVKEAPAGTLEFGIGYGEYERYRGFIDLSYRNLFGMNRQVSVRTEFSSLEKRLIFNYYDPRLFDSETSLRITPFYEERKEKNIDTGEILYQLRRYSERTGIEIPLRRYLKLELAHEFSLVKTYNLKPEVILPREDTGTLAISSFIPGLIYDSRDNPFDPRKGFLAGGRFKIASNLLGSEIEFLKITGDASTYLSLSKRFVIAIGLKGGIAWPYGKSSEIPVVERFFLGGRSSVRGFSQDSLGPKVDDTPVGGDSFIQTNVELRIYPLRNFSFVTFLDGGNVWLKDQGISLGDLRYSAGIGIRYNTPAGPVRLDYGQKIDRLPGESRGEVHFSIGHAF
jgi:outer membrane protein insertion porin family